MSNSVGFKYLDMELFLKDMFGEDKVFAEYHFHDKRKWRFDFAIPHIKMAIEIEGAVFAQGRHVRGSGYSKDCEKYNHATVLGWKVYRFPSNTLKSGEAFEFLKYVVFEIGY